MSASLKAQLISADRLLFATVDDDLRSFVSVAYKRALLGRPTMALFLRPQTCFGPPRAKTIIKRIVFSALKHVPKIAVASIVPFSLEPKYTKVVRLGLHDPQWWDMHDGNSIRQPKETSLASEVRRLAEGRPIVCWLGAVSAHKGFAFMVDVLEANPQIARQICFVAVGTAASEEEQARRFVVAGGVHVDRRPDDEQWESLYAVADAVWACYHPEYDQASGIFGRALQFGVPAIVRRGALIHRAAQEIGIPVIPLDFGKSDQAAIELATISVSEPTVKKMEEIQARIESWRKAFISSAAEALEGSVGADKRMGRSA